MSDFEQYQRLQEAHRLATEYGGELVECECGCSFFEQVHFDQYLANRPVVIGQAIPYRPGIPSFYMLRCAKCGKLHEPNLTQGGRDTLRQQYDQFLDLMEKK